MAYLEGIQQDLLINTFMIRNFICLILLRGFEQTDIKSELSLGNLSYNNGRFVKDITLTGINVKYLFVKMKYPENIQICKGYFPETAKGIEDMFCFVNLDMDYIYQCWKLLDFLGIK